MRPTRGIVGRLAAGDRWISVHTRSHAYLPGRETLTVDSLISPLRYDVKVRVEYFQFLSEHLDTWEHDPEEYLREALRLPYFTWFRHVELPRVRPWYLRRRSLLVEAYRSRLRRSAELFWDFRENGLRPEQSLLMRRIATGASTRTGKPVQHRYALGDGCHRFALFVWSGGKELAQSAYRVRRGVVRHPLDNTYLLLPHLDLDREEYFRFVSRGYLDHEVTSQKELLTEVERRIPERLDEVKRVVTSDLSMSDFGPRRNRNGAEALGGGRFRRARR